MIQAPYEQCDTGNLVSGDGCDNRCVIETCGDGTVQPSEACDDRNGTPNDGCSPTCQLETCGDGTQQANEGCDDGNTTSGDGCSNTCVVESCGDGITQTGLGEECDDGNQASNDGCNSCKEEVCGDGIINVDGEVCDDGNTVDGDGCSSICLNEICGDGITQTGLGEECDGGAHCVACKSTLCDGEITEVKCSREDDNSPCKATVVCKKKNGVVTEDPNPEYDVTCKNNTSCHTRVCGDGELEGAEECDDHNTVSGDGCSSVCILEYCGDEEVQSGLNEECDLGEGTNGKSGSTCSAACKSIGCKIACDPVVNAATKKFEMHCTASSTTSEPLPGDSKLEYQAIDAQNVDLTTGDGTCPIGGKNAQVKVELILGGFSYCEAVPNFACDVCNEVPNAPTLAEAQAGHGCNPGWNCTATKGNPNDGWSSRDPITGNCYCLPKYCISTDGITTQA